MDRGTWQAAVHGVTKSWTRLRNSASKEDKLAKKTMEKKKKKDYGEAAKGKSGRMQALEGEYKSI